MKKRIKKIALFLLAIGLLGLLVIYFVCTSSSFLTSIVLPQVSQAAGIEIKAKKARLSFFESRLEFEDFSVGNKNAPFLKGDKLGASFALFSIIGGNIKLRDIQANRLDISLTKNLEGQWNTSSKAGNGSGAEKSGGNSTANTAASDSSPLLLDLQNVKINDLNFYLKIEKKSEHAFELKTEGVSLSLPELKNGKAACLTVGNGCFIVKGNKVDMKAGKLKMELKTLLNAAFKPENLEALLLLDNLNGQISGTDLGGRAMKFELSSKIKDKTYLIEKCRFRETTGNRIISSLALNGEIAPSPLTFDLDIHIPFLSPELTILALDAIGEYKLGKPGFRFSAHASFDKNILKSKGEAICSNVNLNHPDRKLTASIPVNLYLMHDLELNFAEKIARLNVLDIKLDREKRNILDVHLLNKPSSVSWQGGRLSSPDTEKPPKISIKISELNLTQANLFIPSDSAQSIKSGFLNADITVAALPKGNVIEAGGRINLNSLSLNGSNLNTDAVELHKTMNVKLTDFSKLSFSPISLALKDKKQKNLAELETSGGFDIKTGRGSAKLTVSEINGELIKILPDNIKNNQSQVKLTSAIRPFKTVLNMGLELDLKQKSATIDSFNFSVHSKELKKISLESVDPIKVSWTKGADIAGTLVNAHLSLFDINAALINEFIAPESSFKINSGTISGTSEIRNSPGGILLKGKAKAKDLSFSSGSDKYKNLLIDQTFNVKFARDGNLQIDSTKTDILSDGKKAGALLSFCSVNLKERNGKAKFFVENLNENIFASLPDKIKKAANIKTGRLNGKVFLNFNAPQEHSYLSSELKITKLSAEASAFNHLEDIKGNLSIQLKNDKKLMTLDKFELNLKDGKNVHLADLNVKAEIKKSPEEKSSATVSSELIKLKRLEDHFVKREKQDQSDKKTTHKEKNQKNILTKTANGAGSVFKRLMSLAEKKDAPEKRAAITLDASKAVEPKPCDISWLNLLLNLNFKRIEYSEHIYFVCNSRIYAKNNEIKLDPLDIGINGTPLKGNGFINIGASGGYPYACKAALKGLQLKPFFKMATGPTYQDSEGVIESFDLDIKGKGFSPPNLQRYLRGGLGINLKDLSLSNNLKSLFFLELIFLPIEVLSDIQKFIPNLSLSQDMTNSINFSKSVLNSAHNLKFKTGEMQLEAEKVIRLKKLLLKGDFVRSLSVEGFLAYNGDLDFDSELNVNRIILPLSINGNVHAMHPDIKKLIPFFLKENAINILNPENFKGSLKALGKKLEKGLEKSGEEIEKEGDEKAIDKDQEKLDDAIKKTKKLFDIFMDDKKDKK